MKVAFVSNYFNHHQKPFCDAMNKACDEYMFVSTTEMSSERRSLGYGGDGTPPYVKFAYASEDERKKCQEFVSSADIVIIGSAPDYWIKDRIKNGKVVFRYSERPLRKGIEPAKYLPRFIKWHLKNPVGKPIYMLCASAYTASDYRKFGLFKNRAYKWGYFPQTKTYEIEALLNEKSTSSILWCGRFLALKHPDDAINAIARLKKEGYKFKLSMIGRGEFESTISDMIKENGLDDCVELLGSMPPEKVREYMEKSGIYLFNSDKREGWGAVLNEAMNSACAVITSHEVGAAPFLVNDGENGFIYESGNVDMLYQKIKYLLDNESEQKRIGRAAYHTITDKWNAEEAAKRLLALYGEITKGEKYPDIYFDGPCSASK